MATPERSAYYRQRRAKAKAAGTCTHCFGAKAAPGRPWCETCIAGAAERYAAKKAAGTCPQNGCDQPRAPDRSYCAEHLRIKREKLRAYKARRFALAKAGAA